MGHGRPAMTTHVKVTDSALHMATRSPTCSGVIGRTLPVRRTAPQSATFGGGTHTGEACRHRLRLRPGQPGSRARLGGGAARQSGGHARAGRVRAPAGTSQRGPDAVAARRRGRAMRLRVWRWRTGSLTSPTLTGPSTTPAFPGPACSGSPTTRTPGSGGSPSKTRAPRPRRSTGQPGTRRPAGAAAGGDRPTAVADGRGGPARRPDRLGASGGRQTSAAARPNARTTAARPGYRVSAGGPWVRTRSQASTNRWLTISQVCEVSEGRLVWSRTERVPQRWAVRMRTHSSRQERVDVAPSWAQTA